MFFTYMDRLNHRKIYVTTQPMDEYCYMLLHKADKKDTDSFVETCKRMGDTITTLP